MVDHLETIPFFVFVFIFSGTKLQKLEISYTYFVTVFMPAFYFLELHQAKSDGTMADGLEQGDGIDRAVRIRCATCAASICDDEDVRVATRGGNVRTPLFPSTLPHSCVRSAFTFRAWLSMDLYQSLTLDMTKLNIPNHQVGDPRTLEHFLPYLSNFFEASLLSEDLAKNDPMCSCLDL